MAKGEQNRWTWCPKKLGSRASNSSGKTRQRGNKVLRTTPPTPATIASIDFRSHVHLSPQRDCYPTWSLSYGSLGRWKQNCNCVVNHCHNTVAHPLGRLKACWRYWEHICQWHRKICSCCDKCLGSSAEHLGGTAHCTELQSSIVGWLYPAGSAKWRCRNLVESKEPQDAIADFLYGNPWKYSLLMIQEARPLLKRQSPFLSSQDKGTMGHSRKGET